MRVSAIASVLVLASVPAFAQGTPVSGPQSGVWNLSGSPYLVVDDVDVPEGGALSIEAGVEVVALGRYRIAVHEGATLRALGTRHAPILMTAADVHAGWLGVRLIGASDNSTLRYCVLEYAKRVSLTVSEVQGGALLVQDCSIVIAGCTFRYNETHNENSNGLGAGVCVRNSVATVVGCSFHDNRADGGAAIGVSFGSTVWIKGNRVTDNASSSAGGGIYVNGSEAIIEENLILRNSAAGWGGGGLASWNLGQRRIRGNVIAYNTAAIAGGGAYLRYGTLDFQNNVVAFNQAQLGGGIYVVNQGAAPHVQNSIVWGNSATGSGDSLFLEPSTGSQVTVRFSDVEGGWPGLGNQSADPLFADLAGRDGVIGTDDDDFRLAAGSPCIDAGDSNALDPEVTFDLDGFPRFVDDPGTVDVGLGFPVVDLGPFEYHSVGRLLVALPRPGLAGGASLLRVAGASPGQSVLAFRAFASGASPIAGCGGLVLGLDQPSLVGSANVDASGAASFAIDVPLGSLGATEFFQVLDRASCQASPIVRLSWQ